MALSKPQPQPQSSPPLQLVQGTPKQYIFATDPGPVNNGYAFIDLETGMVAEGIDYVPARPPPPNTKAPTMPVPPIGILHLYAQQNEIDFKNDQRGEKTYARINKHWISGLLWGPIFFNRAIKYCVVENQIAMDLSNALVRQQTLALEAFFHQWFSGLPSYSLKTDMMLAHFNATRDKDKRTKPHRVHLARQFMSEKVRLYFDKYADDKQQHVADSVLLGRYFWETKIQPHIGDGRQELNVKVKHAKTIKGEKLDDEDREMIDEVFNEVVVKTSVEN